ARLAVGEHLVAAGIAGGDDHREMGEIGTQHGGGTDGVVRHDARLHALAGGTGGELRDEGREATGEGDLGELRGEEEAGDAERADAGRRGRLAERGHLVGTSKARDRLERLLPRAVEAALRGAELEDQVHAASTGWPEAAEA